MKVILHGFGSFPVIFWHMIQCARQMQESVEWAIVLSSDHHLALFSELLGADRVIVLDPAGSAPLAGEEDGVYPGALCRDIEAEKRTFKHISATLQQERAMGMYRQIRRFMNRFAPSHALVSQVEGFDGKAFIAAAKEQGAEVVVPTSCRNLGGIFFSPDDQETLPRYASAATPEHRQAAEAFIQSFRESPKPARCAPDASGDDRLESFEPPLPVRAMASLRRWVGTPGGFQWDYLRASVLNNVPVIRDIGWKTRRRLNERYCDVRSLDALPRKFIFYPLQYSPESSINTPAPYFLDQFRAIDAIRFAMPSDCLLVVKEHPACILLRNASFVRRLQCTAGVVVAYYALPSLELVKRAGLTISVTGTATFEALLLGRRAVTLGSSLVSGFLGGVCPLSSLSTRIATDFGAEIPQTEVVSSVASLFSVRYEVVFGSPGTLGEPVLRRKNIECLTQAFIDHTRRSYSTKVF
ncbi:MAG: hypothetical protein SGJ26_10430 [Nitrospirota bacterium]|mgnify:CR=1 FL=1|nr:hypothetical protein [Nitrospirota bacterium]